MFSEFKKKGIKVAHNNQNVKKKKLFSLKIMVLVSKSKELTLELEVLSSFGKVQNRKKDAMPFDERCVAQTSVISCFGIRNMHNEELLSLQKRNGYTPYCRKIQRSSQATILPDMKKTNTCFLLDSLQRVVEKTHWFPLTTIEQT